MMLRSALPEARRGALRKLLSTLSRPVRVLEAHSGLSAMIANDTSVSLPDGTARSFDGIWVSSLTESGSRGLPDIELRGLVSRVELSREIAAVTRKPILVDGDTGGTVEQLQYYVRTLESLGASALMIEDKVFPKNNSLALDKPQVLEDPGIFAKKIAAVKQAQKSADFMLLARIESLVAGRDLADALARARTYLDAGADGIVVHSRLNSPDEVLQFSRGYRELCAKRSATTPLVAIPTTYNSITEDALYAAGFKVVIYANHLLRSAYLAMKATAAAILESGRSLEVEARCAPMDSLFEAIDSAADASNPATASRCSPPKNS
jgi:phosphoenolpyruvate phosphomutase